MDFSWWPRTRSSLSILVIVSIPVKPKRVVPLSVPVVHARIVTLHFQSRIRCQGLEDEVIIAVRAELITKNPSNVSHECPFPGRGVVIPLLKLSSILTEALLAFFACKDLSHTR